MADHRPSPTDAPAGADRAEIVIDAPADELWDLISDVTQMGRWSPECYRCTWLDGGTGPRAGARFKGWNRQDVGPLPLRWSTVSTVEESVRGEVFSFVTKDSAATWTFRFEPLDELTTRVTETRVDGDKPLLARAFAAVVPGRAERQRDGMHATLERLKAAAETSD